MIDSRIAALTAEQRRKLATLLDEVSPGTKSPELQKQLVAWVSGSDRLSETALREQATTRLPSAAVPRRFVIVDEIPRTANGKVDRQHLINNCPAPKSLQPTDTISSTEATLLKIWSQVLATDDFDRDDHFFEVGGDSLAAIRMIALAHEAGLAISIGMLNEHQSLRSLAIAVNTQKIQELSLKARPVESPDSLGRDVSMAFRRAVEDGDVRGPLQLTDRDDLPPMILIPPQGHLVSHLWGIVANLNRYSAWAPVSDPNKELASQTIEELAAEYLLQIREIQPHGPYRLAGFCEGAYAAWELARILQAGGEEVRFVGLIDTPNPDGLRPVNEGFHERTIRRLKHFQGQGPFEVVSHFAKRSCDWMRRRLRRAVTGERHLTRGGKRTAWLFRPALYDGRVTLFRVLHQVIGEASAFETDVSYGWGDLAKRGLDICYVPGDRLDFMSSPHVEVLAERMETAMWQNEANG